MRIDPIQLENKSRFIKDYREHKDTVMDLFDYSPFYDYHQRVNDLKKRSFKREELADALLSMNKGWGASKETMQNIERLRNPESVVVIGGQQAGLLSGPMYTINKIISILKFAKEQEETHNIPVIPVFWIAGEDHDFAEINHVYIPQAHDMKKHNLSQFVDKKYPISKIKIDQKLTKEWMDAIFLALDETAYTNKLYHMAERCLKESETFVDFFASFIFELFNDYGLVLLDSDHKGIRSIQTDYFEQLIHLQPKITDSVFRSLQALDHKGYAVDLDVDEDNTHLFYHLEEERVLLNRTKEGKWIGKNEEVLLTTEELLKIAKNSPEKLSNNVITRPMMQELLLPTLSFIGGDGEISYWAVLKEAFHALGVKMPPVLPRLSFTYIDQNTEKHLEKFSIDREIAINYGVGKYKVNWLAAQQNPPIEKMVNQVQKNIELSHESLQKVAYSIRSDLGDLAKKNLNILQRELNFLENRLLNALEDQYEVELKRFDQVNRLLNPHGGLQERVWNVVLFINDHGFNFIEQLLKENCSFKEEHLIVYI